MANYVVNSKQLASGLLMVVVVMIICTWFTSALLNFLDLPDVQVNSKGSCVKVINYKNGDGYTCQDQDVVLRKYNLVHVR